MLVIRNFRQVMWVGNLAKVFDYLFKNLICLSFWNHYENCLKGRFDWKEVDFFHVRSVIKDRNEDECRFVFSKLLEKEISFSDSLCKWNWKKWSRLHYCHLRPFVISKIILLICRKAVPELKFCITYACWQTLIIPIVQLSNTRWIKSVGYSTIVP